jgi:DNA-binding beta-propeller fold protein YncE
MAISFLTLLSSKFHITGLRAGFQRSKGRYMAIIRIACAFLFLINSNLFAQEEVYVPIGHIGYEKNFPWTVAVNAEGNVYITDNYNDRIKIFNSAGTLVKTFGTSGSGDGEFNTPWGITLDTNGNLYVVDKGNDRVQVFNSEGIFVRKFGSPGTGDGQFGLAHEIAVGPNGNICVTDLENYNVQIFSSDGTFIKKIGTGITEGKMTFPNSVMIDGLNRIYIVDGYRSPEFNNNYRVQILDETGEFISQFNAPLLATGITSDASGNVYITNPIDSQIEVYTSTGTFLKRFDVLGGRANSIWINGIASRNGKIYVADRKFSRVQVFNTSGENIQVIDAQTTGIENGQFNQPQGLDFDANGNIYVADTENDRIQVFSDDGTFLRTFGSPGSANSQFNTPSDVAIGSNGNVFVTDKLNDRVQIFSSEGVFIGKFGSTGTGNGQFSAPVRIAADHAGKNYIIDSNDRVQVFTNDGTFVRTFGTLLADPTALALDDGGNIYLGYETNFIQMFTNSGTFIRKFDMTGTTGGLSVDDAGNIYTTESTGSMVQVLNSDGVSVNHVGYDYPESVPQTLDGPQGIKFHDSKLYIADTKNNRIQIFKKKTQATISSFFDKTITFGDSPLKLTATTNSDAGIVYTPNAPYSTGEVTISTDGTNTITVNKAGVIYIKASVAETDNFTFAETRMKLQVNKANTNLTFTEIPNKFAEQASFPLTISSNSSSSVELEVTEGADLITLAGRVVTMLGKPGIVTIQATQAANENYNAATSVSRTFEIKDPVLGVENKLNQEFSISPNPAHEQFTARTRHDTINKIKMINGIGEETMSITTPPTHEITVQLSKILPGIYSVQVLTSQGKKLIKRILIE